MAHVVCQVLARPDCLSVLWSEGTAAFEPYHKTGATLARFLEAIRHTRDRLADLATAATPAAVAHASYALAQTGHDLFRELFEADIDRQAVASEIRDWFTSRAGSLELLEVLSDQPGLVPWNALYEEPPEERQFIRGGDTWKHFWGVKYLLSGGRRVSPLRQFPVLVKPTVQFIIDPGARDRLPPDEKKRLADFLIDHAVAVASQRGQVQLEGDPPPDVVFCLCRTSGDSLHLGEEALTPEDLHQLLEAGGPTGGTLLVAALCPDDGDSAQGVSTRLAALPFGGLVLTQHAPGHASLGNSLSLLERFLYREQSLGQALHELGVAEPQTGLMSACLAPASLQVERTVAETSEGIQAPGATSPAPLKSDAAPEGRDVPLPEQPYRPLRPYEADAEALFVGREDDLQRLTLLLDRAETRLTVLHGAPGVGKSSLLRAGLLPFLEADGVGYRVLGDRTAEEGGSEPAEADAVPLTVRATGDPTSQLATALAAFCARPYRFTTPTGRTVEVDFADALTHLGGGVVATPEGAAAPEIDPDVLGRALAREPELIGRVLTALTERLPFELVIVVEQGEEMFSLTDEDRSPRKALALLRHAAQSRARVKVVLALRTEFHGQLFHHLQPGAAATPWWGEYLLKPLGRDVLLDALLLPTVDEPLSASSESPYRKYGFAYEPGLPEQLIDEVQKTAAQRQLSAVALMQVVAARLVEKLGTREQRVVRAGDLRQIGGVPEALGKFIEHRVSRLPRLTGDRASFQLLLNSLVYRQPDGTVTRDLVSLPQLQKEWRGTTPLETMVLAAAADDVGLLAVEELTIDGQTAVYVSLVSDALATAVAQEVVTQEKWQHGYARMADTLWITIPIIILLIVAALRVIWYFWGANTALSNELDEANKVMVSLGAEHKKFGAEEASMQFPTYTAQVQLAQQALDGGDSVKLRQYLLRCKELVANYPGQEKGASPIGFDWRYLWQQADDARKTLVGHRGKVTKVVLSADGKTAVSASFDKTVCLWDLEKGLLRVQFKGHPNLITAVALSPDGKQIASEGGVSGDILLWDVPTNRDQFTVVTTPTATLKGHQGAVSSLVYAPDGKTLASGDMKRTIKLWDLAKRVEKQTLESDGNSVFRLEFAPDGKQLASTSLGRGGAEASVQLWTIVDGKVEAKPATTLKHGNGPISDLAYAPDGKHLATIALEVKDGTIRSIIRFWDAAGKEVKTFSAVLVSTSFTFIGDGSLMAVGGETNEVLLLDTANGKERGRLRGHLGWVKALAATKDGKTLITGSADQTLKVWDPTPRLERDVLRPHKGAEVYSVAFMPEDDSEPQDAKDKKDKRDQFLASAGADGSIKLYNVTTGKEAATLSGHKDSVLCLAFGPNGRRLASGGADGTIRLWDTADPKSKDFGKELVKLTGHKKEVLCLSFSNSGTYLVSGGMDHSVRIWKFDDLEKAVKSVDPYLIIGPDAKEKGNEELAPHTGPVRCVALIEQKKTTFLITGSDDATLREWNVTQKHANNVQKVGEAAINALVVWSNSNPVATVACADRTLHNRLLPDKEDISILRGHSTPVLALTFTPNDPRTLAAGGWDGVIKLWDPIQRAERLTLRGHTRAVSSLAFSEDGRLLASASHDGTVRLWRAAPVERRTMAGHP